MTSTNFKLSLQSELKTEGFNNQIANVREIGVNTVVEFKTNVDQKLIDWLNQRFVHGVTVDKNIVLINTPRS